MAMLDMLQLPDGSYGMPAAQPMVDPYTGRDPREIAAERLRRSIRRPAPAAIDYGDWQSGAAPVPFTPGGPGLADAAAGLAAPPAAPAPSPLPMPAAAPAPMGEPPAAAPGPSAMPPWEGMLNAPLPADIMGGGYPRPTPAPVPSPAALPPASAPASGPIEKPASVPPTSVLGRMANGIGDMLNNRSSTLLALGAGLMGSQNIGQGLSRGFAAAIPAQQADIKQQQQNQTVAALIKRGMPPDVALAAAGNPAIMQQIIGQVFGPKALQHVTVKDRMGNEIPMAFDPSTGKYTPANTGGAASSLTAGDPTKTGEDYLKTLDPLTQNEVKAFAEGRAPVTARNLQTMLPLVTQYDPSFDATQYPVRLATRKSYTSGKDFQETQALNTVAGHMGRLADAAEGLGNTGFKPWNYVKNAAADMTVGSPALVKFRNDLVTTQNELAKAYHGGHVSDSAYNAFNKAIGEAQTPAELKTAIGEISGLLQSKIEAKESGYRSSMGAAPLPSEFKAINDEARHSFQKIGDWAHGVKPAAGEAPARPAAPASGLPGFTPKPGGTYRWDETTGHMIEVK